MHQKKWSFWSNIKTPELFFIIIGAIFGLILVFIVPPFQTPDETVHFERAYQVSTGQLTEQKINNSYGGLLPASLVTFVADSNQYSIASNANTKYYFRSETKKLWSIKSNNHEGLAVDFPSPVAYPPVAYFPQAAGMLIGRIMTSRLLIMFYLGRLFNLPSLFRLILCGY